jgi:hypothetical protein
MSFVRGKHASGTAASIAGTISNWISDRSPKGRRFLRQVEIHAF